MLVAEDVAFDFLEEVVGKDELVEGLVGGVVYLVHVAHPFAVALVDEHDVLADAEHRVHVVGVDDGGDVVFVGDVAEQFVDHDRGAGVEARVGLVAEEVFGIEGDGAGDGHTFLHTARDLGGVFVVGALEVDALDTELGTVMNLGGSHVGEHGERESHVAEHGLGVKERRALERAFRSPCAVP